MHVLVVYVALIVSLYFGGGIMKIHNRIRIGRGIAGENAWQIARVECVNLGSIFVGIQNISKAQNEQAKPNWSARF